MEAWIIWHRDGSATFSTPYEPAWIEDLKDSVPFRERTWDGRARTWTIEPAFARFVRDLTAVYFTVGEAWSYQRAAPPSEAALPSAASLAAYFKRTYPHHAVLGILPDAPPEVVTAVYRALAHTNHPDHGGDADRMKKINRAYEELRPR